MTRVLIDVYGGIVTEVLADGPVEVCVKDWDNLKQCEDPSGLNDVCFGPPDRIVDPATLDKYRDEGLQELRNRWKGQEP